MTDDSFEAHLPDDLQSVGDALRTNRAVADGHLLERVEQRINDKCPRRRRHGLLTPRGAGMVTLALAAALGVRLSHVNVADAVASFSSSISQPISNQPNNSPAGAVYCGPGSASGSGGWAPTFRWHYGYPTPNTMGADDGWSPSVQPSCPSGTLSIRFNGGSVTVNPGNPIQFGYDFHQANKPAFTMTAFNPEVAFTYKCGNGSTMTFVPSAMNPELWTGGTYSAPANSPDWIPTGTKTDPAGFQGALVVPALCGAGKPVTFTGGTFSATIKIT